MTNQDTQSMDSLLAEHIMGWKLYPTPTREGMWWYNADGIGLPFYPEHAWNPQNNIAQAMNILRDKFVYPEWQWSIINIWQWEYVVRISRHSVEVARVEDASLPAAICRACLQARGISYAEIIGATRSGPMGE